MDGSTIKPYPVRRAYLSFIILNFAVYGLNGMYYGYIGQYVSERHTPADTGLLLSVGPLVAAVAPLFWGWLADRSKNKNSVLACAVVLTASSFCFMPLSNSLYFMLLVITAVTFFSSPYASLVDTVSLEYSTEHHMSFGVMRVTGTLAFGVIAFLMSWLYSKNEQTLFTAYAALALICVVTALRAPRVKGHAKKSEKYSLRPIFADRRLMLYIAANAVSQFTWMCYLNNFPTYLVEDRGAPQWLWGMNVFVTILGEIPFFLCIDRLFRRFSARVLLAGALTLSSLRCFALVFSGTAVPLLTTALLTGFAPTVLIYIAARHINDHVPQELRASGQNVMYALTYGLPRFLAGIVGGYVLTYSGVPQLMMMCGIVFMTASVIFMISEKKLPLYDENLK